MLRKFIKWLTKTPELPTVDEIHDSWNNCQTVEGKFRILKMIETIYEDPEIPDNNDWSVLHYDLSYEFAVFVHERREKVHNKYVFFADNFIEQYKKSQLEGALTPPKDASERAVAVTRSGRETRY